MIRDLYVIVDENYTLLDERVGRLVVCATEISRESFERAKKEFQQIKDRACLDEREKFHFTDIRDTDIRLSIVDAVVSLGVKNKTFVYYGNIPEAELRRLAIKKAIGDLKKKLSKKYKLNFIVESAEEYKSLIKENYLTSDKTITILADVFCSVMSQRLDYAKKRALISSLEQAKLLSAEYDQNKENDRIYFSKLSILNRLEVYDFCGCKGKRLHREFKMRPVE